MVSPRFMAPLRLPIVRFLRAILVPFLAERIAAVHRHVHVSLFAAHVLPICSWLERVELGEGSS